MVADLQMEWAIKINNVTERIRSIQIVLTLLLQIRPKYAVISGDALVVQLLMS